tara:strand:- start:24 stop:530 length:507 start_codon:yes stop_codon:yes gene_type:complete
MRFLILFIFLISNSFSAEVDIKNLVINKHLKKYDNLTFMDVENKQLNLEDFKGNLVLLNFWATWCAPCKEEMPSLDSLQIHENLDNLKIFAINIGQEDLKKASEFFQDLEINNINLFFGSPIVISKKFGLRGIPTSILFNKDGLEFARIIGSTDFKNEKFIEWLSNYN